MPVIELHSPEPSPGSEVLQRLSAAVTSHLSMPAGQCWVLWRQVDEGEAYRPEWADRSSGRAPIGFVTCKESWSREQVGAVLRLLAGLLATELSVPEQEVYLTARRAAPGELLVRGGLWDGEQTPAPVVAQPIGTVVGGRREVADDDWGKERAVIRLDAATYGPEALFGLDSFSHVEVVYHFDRVKVEKIETGARQPRGNKDWPLVGIFAQRGKNRPNRIGVSRCRIVKVDGLDVHVEGLDAVAGTPVLDLKPYMTEFAPRGGTVQPAWSTEIMRAYY